MHGHAWTYNNVKIVIKINILLTDSIEVTVAAGRRTKAVLTHLTILLQLFNKFDSIQTKKKIKNILSRAKNSAESPLYLGPTQPKKGLKTYFYIHKPYIHNSITSHSPSWAHPNSHQSHDVKLQFSPYNWPFLQKLPK